MTVWWPKHVASNLNNKILLCLTENVYIRCLSVSIFVCRNIKCNTLYIIYYITEACAIQLDSTYNELGILTIYISPRGNFTNFLNRLGLILQKFYSSKYSIAICGDVNVYCLIDINIKSQLDAVWHSYNVACTVKFPTKIGLNSHTAIGSVFIVIHASTIAKYDLYPLINGLSDHDTQ